MRRTSLEDLNGNLGDEIMRLIEEKGGSPNADILKEMMTTTLGLIDDDAGRLELKILNAALKEMRKSFQVFAPYSDVRKVSVFGSARTAPEAPEVRLAAEFARRIVAEGYMVITGAGGGVMLGANEGAGRDRSFGCLISLPFEPSANEVIVDDEKLITYKYFFTRKLTFVKESDGLVLFPGGFGTLDECYEALTLIQTGKSDVLPLVFLDVPGGDYWQSFERHASEQLRRRGLISEDDRHFYLITESVDEAVDEITRFYSNYHSTRYVREKTVIRHSRAIDDERLDRINREFAGILKKGTIERSDALAVESDEASIATYPRLVLEFDRRQFGRFRQLINILNED